MKNNLKNIKIDRVEELPIENLGKSKSEKKYYFALTELSIMCSVIAGILAVFGEDLSQNQLLGTTFTSGAFLGAALFAYREYLRKGKQISTETEFLLKQTINSQEE